MSEKNQIKSRLLSGRGISPLFALKTFGCFRLAARINELRNEGMSIKTTMMQHDTKRFAYYEIKKS